MNGKVKGVQAPVFGVWPGVRVEDGRHALEGWLRRALHGVDVRDALGGLVLFALGLFAAVYGQRYAFGTPMRMGPGFFPVSLGVLLCAYGIWATAMAFVRRAVAQPVTDEAAVSEPVEWLNLAAVTVGLVSFGLLLNTAGMVVATSVAVGIYALADRGCTLLRSVALAALITGATLVVFIWGLKMLVPVWWG